MYLTLFHLVGYFAPTNENSATHSVGGEVSGEEEEGGVPCHYS